MRHLGEMPAATPPWRLLVWDGLRSNTLAVMIPRATSMAMHPWHPASMATGIHGNLHLWQRPQGCWMGNSSQSCIPANHVTATHRGNISTTTQLHLNSIHSTHSLPKSKGFPGISTGLWLGFVPALPPLHPSSIFYFPSSFFSPT